MTICCLKVLPQRLKPSSLRVLSSYQVSASCLSCSSWTLRNFDWFALTFDTVRLTAMTIRFDAHGVCTCPHSGHAEIWSWMPALGRSLPLSRTSPSLPGKIKD